MPGQSIPTPPSPNPNWFCRRLAAVVLAAVLADVVGEAQQAGPQRAPGTLKEGVTAVLVDVVVRDRRGQPVKDLSEADFEILENGVPQKLASFTPVFEGTPPPSTAAPGAARASSTPSSAVGTPAPMTAGPGVTAIVFHSLSPEGRRLAVEAAQGYLGSKEEMAHYVGIFGLDLSLRPLVPFTRNGVAVRQALGTVAASASATFASPEMERQKANAEQQAKMAGQAAAAAEGAGPGASAAMGGAPGEAQLAQMQADIIEGFDRMAGDQEGYVATDGLFAIVRALGRLPGRKSVVLFSEGISIPPAVHRLFLGVIDAANRANVSFYTIDAAGLRASSEQSRIRDQVNSAAGFGINTAYSGDGGGGPLTRELFEANEANLRSDPATGLGQLAQDTGGLLFQNTNNLRPAFERIESDLRNYYLLGYTPANSDFDGRFRTIEVKVKRPGMTVAARKGYFAVRDPGGAPVNEWEAPALGALEQRPVPNAFPVRAAAFLFPERGRPGLVPVVVDLKTAPLTFQPAQDGKTYTSDFTVLVRFLDAQNQVIRKVSQHYDVRGQLSEIDRAKQGEVIFYRESELPSGVYTMESIVYDALSGKSSVRFSTVEVPKHEEGRLRMSSLVLVKRGEKVQRPNEPRERRVDSPLLVNDVALSPNLGEPVSRAAKEVGFYFAIYPAPGGRSPDSLIQLLNNGTPVAQIPMPVAQADASGRIQQLGRLPIAGLAPETYELRAIVKQGNEQMFRSTMLRIVD